MKINHQPIKQSTKNSGEALEIFFGKVLPIHTQITTTDAKKCLDDWTTPNQGPDVVLRTISIDELKASVFKIVSQWDSELPITDYILSNTNGCGDPDAWADFETQSPRPKSEIRGMIGSTKRRVIRVWRTPDEYLAWASSPWPKASFKKWWQFWK